MACRRPISPSSKFQPLPIGESIPGNCRSRRIPPSRRPPPDHIVQAERHPKILGTVGLGRVNRLPLPSHRAGVEPEAKPAMALEPCGDEALRIGQVAREPPHQLKGVAKALPSGVEPSENDGQYTGARPAFPLLA